MANQKCSIFKIFLTVGLLISLFDVSLLAMVSIANSGVPECVIVRPLTASIPEQYAANELAVFLNQITGATFTIRRTPDSSKSNIFIGVDAAKLIEPSFSTFGLGEEGIVIRTVGNDLILAGAGTRGTLYAVYTFLEDYLGCRWWTSTESTIPNNPTVSVDSVDTIYIPTFQYRETNYYDAITPDFAVRNKYNGHHHNLDFIHGGKMAYTATSGWYVHTFWSLLSPDVYYSSHPEWYVLYNGVPATLALDNEEMRLELVNNLKAHLSIHSEASLVSVSQIDDNGFPGQLNGGTTPEGGNESDLLISFINKVAEDIEVDYPDILISTLGYHYTQTPPNFEVPRNNVVIRLANIGCSFSVPVSDDRNATFRDDFLGWSAITDKLYIWSYASNFTFKQLPHPNLRALGANVGYYANNSVKGLFYESPGHSAPGSELGELRTWFLAKLLWNPSLDPNTLIEEFCNGYYGPAGPYIINYLNIMHDKVEQTGDYLGISSPTTADFLCFETLDSAWTCILDAEAAVQGDSILLGRVQKVKETIAYARECAGVYDDLYVTTSSQHLQRLPVKCINGEGLTSDGLRHISLGFGAGYGMNVWASLSLAESLANPHSGTISGSHWIEFKFDQIHSINKMLIWNYHEYIPNLGLDYRSLGFKDVTIQYSTTGGSEPSEWITMYDGQIPMTLAVEETPVSLTVDFGGVLARYVVITADSANNQNWSNGAYEQVGLSEVQFDGNSVEVAPEFCGEPGTVYLLMDFNKDCYVDLKDFAEFALQWLNCNDPANTNCDIY